MIENNPTVVNPVNSNSYIVDVHKLMQLDICIYWYLKTSPQNFLLDILIAFEWEAHKKRQTEEVHSNLNYIFLLKKGTLQAAEALQHEKHVLLLQRNHVSFPAPRVVGSLASCNSSFRGCIAFESLQSPTLTWTKPHGDTRLKWS